MLFMVMTCKALHTGGMTTCVVQLRCNSNNFGVFSMTPSACMILYPVALCYMGSQPADSRPKPVLIVKNIPPMPLPRLVPDLQVSI
jgi:hypothetical protein